jgi:cytochrome c peroxidase
MPATVGNKCRPEAVRLRPHDQGCKPFPRRYNTRMDHLTRRRRVGLAVIGLGLAAWSLVLAVRPGSGHAEEPVVQTAAQEISREAVWRAIFARPHEQPPFDPAKAALGRDLFGDVRLSGAGHASCASCHDPDRAFTDGLKTAVGPGGAVLARNAPALYNLAWATSFFWDGRAGTLADQARVPILAPNELAGDFGAIARRLADDPAMRARFAAAFPAATGVSETSILDALVAYEQSLVSPQTRFDQWVEGDAAALTEEEAKGFDIFVGKGGCVSCHGGWRLTDDNFHDVGLPSKDLGRGALASGAPGLPEFKTPSLREVARTAPYMHDGSMASLEDVVDHYSDGLLVRPSLAPTLVRDLKLTKSEKAALIAFLKTLSSEQKSHTTDETTRPMLKK